MVLKSLRTILFHTTHLNKAMSKKRKKDEYTIGNARVETFSGGQQPTDMVLSPIRPNAPNRRTLIQEPVAKQATPLPPEKPTYLTRENAPGVGWQSRMQRNKDLDDNYRTQLQTFSQGGIAKTSDQGAMRRALVGTRSSERIADAKNRSAASLLGTQLGAQSEMRGEDRGAAERAALRREVFERETGQQQIEASRSAQREATAASLLTQGVFKSPEAYGNYAALGPQASIGGMQVPEQRVKLERIAPLFEKTLSGAPPRMLQPEGVFNPITGVTTYETPVTERSTEELEELALSLTEKAQKRRLLQREGR